MKLIEHMSAAMIKAPLDATDKTGAITELVNLIAASDSRINRDKLLTAVLERESQRSTGIGKGFAIPHAKTDAVGQLLIALGRCASPIEFQAVDGRPVDLIALLASPVQATSLHIHALAKLTRLVNNPQTIDRLKSAESAEALYQVIVDSDAE